MEFLQAVKQIGIFMICAQMILHFKPSAKYEKYLKLLISIMVLVQILVPVVDLLSGQDSKQFFARMEELQTNIEQEMQQLEIENAINEENILKETKLEIQSRVNELLSEQGFKVSYLEIEDDGETSKLVIYVQEEAGKGVEIPKIEVAQIQLEEPQEVLTVSAHASKQEDEKIHVLRNGIAEELEVNKEEIEVRWYE